MFGDHEKGLSGDGGREEILKLCGMKWMSLTLNKRKGKLLNSGLIMSQDNDS